MEKFDYVITNDEGIHAIPASILANTAKQFESDITIGCGDEKSDLKDLFGIMMMCIKKDSQIVVETSGEDEKEAMVAIKKILEDI